MSAFHRRAFETVSEQLGSVRRSTFRRLLVRAFIRTAIAASLSGSFARLCFLYWAAPESIASVLWGTFVLLFALWNVVCAWRRTPDLLGVARRLDSTGLLAAALDFENDSSTPNDSLELRAATIDAALARLVSAKPRAKLELRRATFDALLLIVPLGVFLIPPTSRSDVAPKLDSAKSAPLDLGALIAPDDVEESVAPDLDAGPRALRESLARARATTERLAEELRSGSGDASSLFALAREIASTIDAPDVGALALSERLAVAALERSFSAWLVARRADATLALLRSERADRTALARRLGAAVRSEPGAREEAANSLDALGERLEREEIAWEILASSRSLARASDELTSALDSARRASLDLLRERVGFDPFEPTLDRAPTTAFVAQIEALDARWTDVRATLEETAERLSRADAAEFVAFAASSAPLDRAPSGTSWAARFDSERARLRAIASNARAERWGIVATELNESGPISAPSDASEEGPDSERLAWVLTLGALEFQRSANGSLADAELSTPDDRTRRADAEPLDAKIDAAVDSSSRAETSEDDATALVENDSIDVPRSDVEASSESGRVSEQVGAPDAFFGGGLGAREFSASPPPSGRAFWAELPNDARERLEAAKKWTPPEEELEKTRAFRRRLWDEMKK